MTKVAGDFVSNPHAKSANSVLWSRRQCKGQVAAGKKEAD
jgi:hypothetical protein